MICAPLAAAWRTSFSARAMFAGRSQEQAIWVAATVTLRVMEHLVCWLGWLPGLAAAGSGSAGGNGVSRPIEGWADLYPIKIGL
ncbi:hypothetical protein ACET47_27205 [Pseudomonas aeruginosa]